MKSTLAPGMKQRASALQPTSTTEALPQKGGGWGRVKVLILCGMVLCVLLWWGGVQVANWGLNVLEGWMEGNFRTSIIQGGEGHQVELINIGGAMEVIDTPVTDPANTQTFTHLSIKNTVPNWPGEISKADVSLAYLQDGTYTITVTANQFDWQFHRLTLIWHVQLSSGEIKVLDTQVQ